MKKIFVLLVLINLFNNSFSQQQENSLPPYLQVPIIPPFSITQTDSSIFKKENLPSKKTVIVIYFNTDCGHCETLIKHITDSMQFMPKTFFVLACYNKLETIAAFEEKYKLKSFENIRVGRDDKYFIPSFYKVKFTPFTAVYNKKGDLIKAYEKGFSVAEFLHLKK